MKSKSIIFSLCLALSTVYGCSQSQPGDSRVIQDLKLNPDGLVDAYCVKGKTGEQYWHPDDNTWYWDRGVVVKRKANISGAPNAVVVVRGLARYHTDGNNYNFYKFLTTDNQYEGIPAPSGSDLENYVKKELNKVFMGRAHNVVEVSSVKLSEDPWVWHTAESFTASFTMNYREIASYTEVADRQSKFEIRFYRKSVDSQINNLMSSEVDRKEIKRTKYSEAELKGMPTIQQQ